MAICRQILACKTLCVEIKCGASRLIRNDIDGMLEPTIVLFYCLGMPWWNTTVVCEQSSVSNRRETNQAKAGPDRLTQPLCLFEILPCSYPPWKHVALPSVFALDTTMCGNPVAQDLVGLVYNLSRVSNTEKQEVANWRRAAARVCALTGSHPGKIWSLEQTWPNLVSLSSKHGDLLSKVSSDVQKLLLTWNSEVHIAPQVHKSIQCCGLPSPLGCSFHRAAFHALENRLTVWLSGRLASPLCESIYAIAVGLSKHYTQLALHIQEFGPGKSSVTPIQELSINDPFFQHLFAMEIQHQAESGSLAVLASSIAWCWAPVHGYGGSHRSHTGNIQKGISILLTHGGWSEQPNESMAIHSAMYNSEVVSTPVARPKASTNKIWEF